MVFTLNETTTPSGIGEAVEDLLDALNEAAPGVDVRLTSVSDVGSFTELYLQLIWPLGATEADVIAKLAELRGSTGAAAAESSGILEGGLDTSSIRLLSWPYLVRPSVVFP